MSAVPEPDELPRDWWTVADVARYLRHQCQYGAHLREPGRHAGARPSDGAAGEPVEAANDHPLECEATPERGAAGLKQHRAWVQYPAAKGVVKDAK